MDNAAIERAYRFRFLRSDYGGVDGLADAKILKAVGDFLVVRAVLPGDILGVSFDGPSGPAISIHTPEATAKKGKYDALGYEVIDIGPDAQKLLPDLRVGDLVDHLASAADLVDPSGSKRLFYVTAQFICQRTDVEAAGKWYDECAAKAKAEEMEAAAALTSIRADMVAQ